MENKARLIDLHTHTTASDGSLSPSQLVDEAARLGLGAVAITDHDTLGGLGEGLTRGEAMGFEVVPGVEISAEFKGGTMHILGYYVDAKSVHLSTTLATLQEARRTRNPRIVEKLRGLGMDITMEEIEAVAGDAQIGRPHFARVMVSKGYAASTQEAFDRYLAKGGPAYMDKFRLGPSEAISMILQGGGLAVLAHPFTLNLGGPALEAQVGDLARGGLVGLEVYYSEHTPAMTEEYLALANKLGLAVTGGTDFHGATKPKIQLGRGLGDMAVPYALLEGLRGRRVMG